MAETVTTPVETQAAPPAAPPAPDRNAARAAKKEAAVKKMAEAPTPAAADPAKTAAAEPAKPAPAAASPAAPAKPKSDLDRIFDEAKRIAGPAPKPVVAAPKPPAPVVAAEPAKPAAPSAADRASIFKIADEYGLDKFDLLRHFTAELKAERALPFTGEPVFDPTREKLTQAEKGFSELRKELDEVKSQNAQLMQTWEQQQAAQMQAIQAQNAIAHLQTDVKRWPVLTRNPDKNAVGDFIIQAVNTAAQYPETRDLTVSEIIDRLEKFEASKLDPYKDLWAPAATEAPSQPKVAAKTVGEHTTIAPGSLAPQSGEPPARRATREERKNRAMEFLRSGK